ncbi:hypothetical protein P8881_19585 [Bacillus haynesii]|uniref:hypothetical protein n=1 Tax=Bacillus haynesii TaxID=1925021 RepID=UPI002281A7E0|nr:hypothetical protein [Bacillus haynesii]MCY8737539.1 hypothetical protein [Bacillus haynesii]MEC0709729.1 hypothetical protein [Bacillus haynesii]MEC0736892.1 hypothetical protein [Bacillus haynesii]
MNLDGGLNPMFNKKNTVSAPSKMKNDQKVKRNQRIDKKHDIKIPLNAELMKMIRRQAFRVGMSATQYAAHLIRIGMKHPCNSFPTPNVPYNPKLKNVHAKLSKYEYSNLLDFQLDFGYTSQRQTAYRILINMIYREQQRL